MDGEGNPVCLCPECRLLAYRRLGQNMTEAEYKIVDAEPKKRKPRKTKNIDNNG